MNAAMDEAELKTLDQEVRRLKRVAGEWAAKLHDLAEERLPAAFEELPALAQAAYDACRAWNDAQIRLTAERKVR